MTLVMEWKKKGERRWQPVEENVPDPRCPVDAALITFASLPCDGKWHVTFTAGSGNKYRYTLVDG